jgi:hypothetical protein
MSRNDPIVHAGIETLSFCQIDNLNQFPKGTAFRLFKAGRHELEEGLDYVYLPAAEYPRLIESLKASGQIYSTTVNLVLITRPGYDKLQRRQ